MITTCTNMDKSHRHNTEQNTADTTCVQSDSVHIKLKSKQNEFVVTAIRRVSCLGESSLEVGLRPLPEFCLKQYKMHGAVYLIHLLLSFTGLQVIVTQRKWMPARGSAR